MGGFLLPLERARLAASPCFQSGGSFILTVQTRQWYLFFSSNSRPLSDDPETKTLAKCIRNSTWTRQLVGGISNTASMFEQIEYVKEKAMWEKLQKHSRVFFHEADAQVVLVIHWKPVAQLMFFRAKEERASSSGKLLSGDDDGPISLTHQLSESIRK